MTGGEGPAAEAATGPSAEWQPRAPVDPILLSQVNATLFAVVAQWDLTPLEQRVLEGRL